MLNAIYVQSVIEKFITEDMGIYKTTLNVSGLTEFRLRLEGYVSMALTTALSAAHPNYRGFGFVYGFDTRKYN